MRTPSPKEAVIVSKRMFDREDDGSLIESNISFVNKLFDAHLRPDEISPDALRSYYVDFYYVQMDRGSFSDFLEYSLFPENTDKWNEQLFGLIREGLERMGAKGHLAIFNDALKIMSKRGLPAFKKFYDTDKFLESREYQQLRSLTDRFNSMLDEEDLQELNANWLRSLPHLLVLTDEEIEEEVRRQVAAIPNMEARIAELRAKEPRYLKLIRALCEKGNLEFSHLTGATEIVLEEIATYAHYFKTDKGVYYMVDLGDRAVMFNSESNERILSISAPKDLYGE